MGTQVTHDALNQLLDEDKKSVDGLLSIIKDEGATNGNLNELTNFCRDLDQHGKAYVVERLIEMTLKLTINEDTPGHDRLRNQIILLVRKLNDIEGETSGKLSRSVSRLLTRANESNTPLNKIIVATINECFNLEIVRIELETKTEVTQEEIPTELTIGEKKYKLGDVILIKNLPSKRITSLGFEKVGPFLVYGSIYEINLETQEVKVRDSGSRTRYIIKISDLQNLNTQAKIEETSKAELAQTKDTSKVEISKKSDLYKREMSIDSVYQSEDIYEAKRIAAKAENDPVKEAEIVLLKELTSSPDGLADLIKESNQGNLETIVENYYFFPREVAIQAYETLVNIGKPAVDFFKKQVTDKKNPEGLFSLAAIANNTRSSKLKSEIVEFIVEQSKISDLIDYSTNALKSINGAVIEKKETEDLKPKTEQQSIVDKGTVVSIDNSTSDIIYKLGGSDPLPYTGQTALEVEINGVTTLGDWTMYSFSINGQPYYISKSNFEKFGKIVEAEMVKEA